MTYHDIISNLAHSGSTQLIIKLFGGEVGTLMHIQLGQGPQETLLTMFGALLAGPVFWGLIAITLYTLLLGLLQQARSGSFMLAQWQGAWPFIRLGTGLMGVCPLPGTHLVLAQAAVIYVALFGSSVADLSWQQLVKTVLQTPTPQATLHPMIPLALTQSYVDAAAHYCQCAANVISHSTPDANLSLAGFNPIAPTGAYQAVARYCSNPGFQAFLQAGQKLMPPKLPDTSTRAANLTADATLSQFNAYQKAQLDYLATMTVLDLIQSKIWPFVTAHLADMNTNPDSYVLAWNPVYVAFQQALQAKVASAILADQKLKASVYSQTIGQYGWISAGNYYQKLAAEQQVISNALAATLQNTPGNFALSSQSNLTAANAMDQFGEANELAVSDQASSAIGHMIETLGLKSLKNEETTDPILAMTQFGQTMAGVAEGLFIGQQVSGAVGQALGKIPLIGGIAKGAVDAVFNNSFEKTFIVMLALGGMILGTILPCLPWVIFLFAILSWLIYVAEMYIAAPFLVVFNALPDNGYLVSSSTKRGFNNILYIALFPLLAIGGLTLSLGISWVGVGLVNQFMYSTAMGILGTKTLPIGFFGLLILYIVLAWSVIMTSLNLIPELPQRVLSWLNLSAPTPAYFGGNHQQVTGVIAGNRLGTSVNEVGTGLVKLGQGTPKP